MQPQEQNVNAKKAEKVPLLKPWKDASSADPRNSWIVVFGWLKYTLIPAFLFSCVSSTFMLGYHTVPHVLIGIAAIIILALLSDVVYIYRQRTWEEQQDNIQAGIPQNSRDRMTRMKITKESMMFLICAFAIFAGGIIGTSIHLTELLDYWPYYQKRHYTNVAPDEPAASHADASVIVFMEGARPDGSREMGYRRHGNLYCVAPIAIEPGYSDSEAPDPDIQYWAIGIDCCGGIKGFHCDDAENAKARSGLVMQELSGADKMLEGIMSNDHMAFFEKAVKMSLTKFDLTSPKERLFVRYVKDINKARNEYYTQAWWSWFKYQCIWLLLFMAAGAFAIVLSAGDPHDKDKYNEHLIDAKQSALWKINHFM
jgi:hypothetical protein